MLNVSNLNLSLNEISEISEFILSCRKTGTHNILGLTIDHSPQIVRVDFWGIPHICIRGFVASFDDVRAYLALNATSNYLLPSIIPHIMTLP